MDKGTLLVSIKYLEISLHGIRKLVFALVYPTELLVNVLVVEVLRMIIDTEITTRASSRV